MTKFEPRNVRLTHIPTGIIVGVKSGDTQGERNEKAYHQLEKKVRKLHPNVVFNRADVQLDIGSNFDVVEEVEDD